MSEASKIVCKNIWKIFGTYPERTLKNLDKSLSRAEVQAQTGHVIGVNDVTFEVKKGETFVVMGLSGSGKSTLVRCISRLIEPTAGEVIIDGEDIMDYNETQLTEFRRFRMSMVFQHFGLFPHRKVIDNIGFGLEIRGMDKKERKQKSMEVLEKVGLHGWADHYPRELSGGMQQR
ncbi:MAG: ATP-binding cassette domain-containing protein, partial [Pseudomonadota bacterium]